MLMESIISAAVGDFTVYFIDMKAKNIKVTGSTINVTLAESGELLQDSCPRFS
jgi:iron complex outermembrane receptor protein